MELDDSLELDSLELDDSLELESFESDSPECGGLVVVVVGGLVVVVVAFVVDIGVVVVVVGLVVVVVGLLVVVVGLVVVVVGLVVVVVGLVVVVVALVVAKEKTQALHVLSMDLTTTYGAKHPLNVRVRLLSSFISLAELWRTLQQLVLNRQLET